MRVVDRDGLDGIFATAGEAHALVGARRPPRRESATGLAALAEATSSNPGVEAAPLPSWTELAPLALVPSEVATGAPQVVRDTRVDDTVPTRLRESDGWSLPPTRIGRHARPTLKPPLGERPMRRIVLSFVVGGAALVAAVILMALQSSNHGGVAADERVATRAEARTAHDFASAAVASLGRGDRGDRGRDQAHAASKRAPAQGVAMLQEEPRPVLAATIDGRALKRRPLLPPRAMLPGGRLEWRLPARFSFGGEAPDSTDDDAIGVLVSTLVERCEPGTVVVTGHTCNLGNDLMNLVIGKRRALFARDLLVAAGLPARGLRVASAASLRPEVSNATAAGRVRNRRVTVACQPLRHDRSTR